MSKNISYMHEMSVFVLRRGRGLRKMKRFLFSENEVNVDGPLIL